MATALTLKIILIFYITEKYISVEAVKPLSLHNNMRIEEYPFYAGLSNCGAVILSNIWIMTAAHCVEKVNTQQKNYVWVGGETFSNSLRVPYYLIYKHQGYTSLAGLPLNDIALLKLSHPLTFTKTIQPIKLPKETNIDSNIIFVGRGIDETGHISGSLKRLDLIKQSTIECIKMIPFKYHGFIQINLKKLQTMNICAKREGDGPSICQDDSGSPLISGDTVVGLASFIGNLDCHNVKLGFFVNVTSYIPWIKTITGL